MSNPLPNKTPQWNRGQVLLMVRRMYDAQKIRIQSDLRTQQFQRDGVVLKKDIEELFRDAYKLEVQVENEYERLIANAIGDLPIVREWLLRIKGIGYRLAGAVIAEIVNPNRFDTAGKLCAYAGFNIDKETGLAVRRKKGTKANWNNHLKVACWKVGKSMVMARGNYRSTVYDPYKKRIILREIAKGNIIWKTTENKTIPAHWPESMGVHAPDVKPPEGVPEWTMGRIEAMSVRRLGKMFLCHLWEVWRTFDGLPTRQPYAVEYLGHSTIINPFDMCDREAKGFRMRKRKPVQDVVVENDEKVEEYMDEAGDDDVDS